MTDLIEHVDMWGDCSCDGFSIGHEAGCQRRIVGKEARVKADAKSRARAADEIAALRARVAELEAENDRLTKAVGSGILGQLLNDEEQDEFVKFIKFLRGSPEAQSVVSNIGGSNDG